MPSGSYSEGQANTVACVSNWITSRLGSISGYPDHPGPRRAQVRHQPGHLGGQLGGVGLPGAQHQLGRRVQLLRGPQQHRQRPSAG